MRRVLDLFRGPLDKLVVDIHCFICPHLFLETSSSFDPSSWVDGPLVMDDCRGKLYPGLEGIIVNLALSPACSPLVPRSSGVAVKI